MDWLIPAFFGTALLYASVGFGGGSTYSALLSLAGFDYRLLPVVSLCCNVLVVSGATLRFARAGVMPWKRGLLLSCIAAPLGYLAGLVGIGGGIFLAPLLHLTRWASARKIAATASLFILINSIAGLAGQLAKNGVDRFAEALAPAFPLLVAVIFGGQLGSLLALRWLPEKVIRWLTAALTIWAGSRLLGG